MVRLARIEYQGATKLAAQVPHPDNDAASSFAYVDLSSIAPDARSFLEAGDAALNKAKDLLSKQQQDNLILPEQCRLLAPIDGRSVGKFLCIGMNYIDHCEEQGFPIPTEPLVFSKFADTCIVGTGTPLARDVTTTKLDYEVELGVVLGATLPRFTTDEAACWAAVGGYTVIHDVSARDWQMEKNGGQWLLGKTVDGYAPLGPVICTTDEFPHERAHRAAIRCRVNGELLQDSNTNQLIFKVADILKFLSQFMTLHAGDVIATGTPPGVGCFRKPEPRWLVPGDVVECEIEGIGTISNPIVEPPTTTTPTTVTPTTSTTLARPGGPLNGRTCIVTGAARGIGYGIAARFAMDDAAVVAVVDLHQDDVDAACQTLRALAPPSCQLIGYACDVGHLESVQTTWARIVREGNGRIDVLVQAAGIVGATNVKTEDVDPDNFDAVFRVNVKGIFHGCKAVLPFMREQKYGRIVNIASIAGKEGNAGMLAYSSSKAAVIGLTKTIGKEYAHSDENDWDITCNALAPAVVRTQMVEDMPDAQVKYMTDKIPMKRCGTIEEIASMVAFMASPQASFTTGFCFDATGGRAVY
mmetsp:Transcript_7714/g.21490  ORF Transcript_7714/g.21490 Transcript_7714/m.21490 type:complete len:583 (+) Transcript_7714:69-1817(+)